MSTAGKVFSVLLLETYTLENMLILLVLFWLLSSKAVPHITPFISLFNDELRNLKRVSHWLRLAV